MQSNLDIELVKLFQRLHFLQDAVVIKEIEHSIQFEGPSGRIQIDPSKILRILVRPDVLSKIEVDQEGYDYENMRESARGSMKGGKMKRRDKRFGYGDGFWDWWHKHCKKKNGGQDIATQAEADYHHDIYQTRLLEVRGSASMQAVRRLSFADQPIARQLLYSLWLGRSSSAA